MRLLATIPPDTEKLWEEAKALVCAGEGILLLDDTTGLAG